MLVKIQNLQDLHIFTIANKGSTFKAFCPEKKVTNAYIIKNLNYLSSKKNFFLYMRLLYMRMIIIYEKKKREVKENLRNIFTKAYSLLLLYISVNWF